MDSEPIHYTRSELMVAAAARQIKDGEVVFVGMRLPLLSFLLAKSTHAPNAVGIYELGLIRETPSPAPIVTMGDLPNIHRANWLSDTSDALGMLQKGEVDTAFIGGAQVDRFGNLNTTMIGTPEKIETRLPGSGGANDLASLAKRHIIIMAHDRRRFVSRVDYLTSPGFGDGPGWRERNGLPRGGPSAVISTLGIFNFHPTTCEMGVASLHPGVQKEEISNETGWPVHIPGNVSRTPPPTENELDILHRFDPEGIWTKHK